MRREAPFPVLLSFALIEAAGAALVLYFALSWWGYPVAQGGFVWAVIGCLLVYVPRRLWLGLPDGARCGSAWEVLSTGVLPELTEMAGLGVTVWVIHAILGFPG